MIAPDAPGGKGFVRGKWAALDYASLAGDKTRKGNRCGIFDQAESRFR